MNDIEQTQAIASACAADWDRRTMVPAPPPPPVGNCPRCNDCRGPCDVVRECLVPPPPIPAFIAPPPPPPAVHDLPYGTQLRAGLGVSTVIADHDFETYSDAGYLWDDAANKWTCLPGASQGKKGLSIVGSAVYAEHPSTEAFLYSYDLKDGRGRRRWRPGTPNPQDLFDHLAAGKLIEAFNTAFECHIWDDVCVPKYGWPPLPHAQVRCAQAKARAHALPPSLDMGAKVMGTQRKDAAGDALMKRFSMPKNPTAKSPARRVLPTDDPEAFNRYHDYNEQDIVAEADLAARVPDLSPKELEFWLVDQAINRRGVQVDTAAIDNCIAIVNEAHTQYNAELRALTGGVVDRASELEKLKGWLGGKGLRVDSLDAEHIEDEVASLRKAIKTLAFVPRPPGAPVNPEHARYHGVRDPEMCLRALEIREAIGSAAVKKLFALKHNTTSKGRVHDLFAYHGARTGRPTGSGPQPTNFPNSGPELIECACGRHFGKRCASCPWCALPVPPGKRGVEWNPEAVEDALLIISTRSLKMVEAFFGDAMAVVCGVLRGMFIAKPGHRLVCADYNAIEAVVLAALAGEEWRLDVFRSHAKIYEASASAITGIPFEEFMRHAGYTDEQLAMPAWWEQEPANKGAHHPMRKKIGKVAELASGFAGWIGAWKAFGADEFFNDKEIKDAIIAWRNASPNIVEFWGGQHRGLPWDANYRPELFGLEGMAIAAVQNPGVEYSVRGFTYLVKDDVLYCRLLSGRYITYHRPRLTPSSRRDNEVSLSYEGYNTNDKFGPKGWIRMDTYSGKLVENIVQAVARDIHTHALVALERAGYPIVLHVYDEAVAEIPNDFGSLEEFERIMADTPEWAKSWPVRATGGWVGPRFRK